MIHHYYRKTEPPHSLLPSIKEELKTQKVDDQLVQAVETESCFNVQLEAGTDALSPEQMDKLLWLLAETFEPQKLGQTTFLAADSEEEVVMEFAMPSSNTKFL